MLLTVFSLVAESFLLHPALQGKARPLEAADSAEILPEVILRDPVLEKVRDLLSLTSFAKKINVDGISLPFLPVNNNKTPKIYLGDNLFLTLEWSIMLESPITRN